MALHVLAQSLKLVVVAADVDFVLFRFYEKVEIRLRRVVDSRDGVSLQEHAEPGRCITDDVALTLDSP